MPSFLKAELYNPHLPKGSMMLTAINCGEIILVSKCCMLAFLHKLLHINRAKILQRLPVSMITLLKLIMYRNTCQELSTQDAKLSLSA